MQAIVLSTYLLFFTFEGQGNPRGGMWPRATAFTIVTTPYLSEQMEEAIKCVDFLCRPREATENMGFASGRSADCFQSFGVALFLVKTDCSYFIVMLFYLGGG